MHPPRIGRGEGIGGDAIAMCLNIVSDVETVKVGEEDGAVGIS